MATAHILQLTNNVVDEIMRIFFFSIYSISLPFYAQKLYFIWAVGYIFQFFYLARFKDSIWRLQLFIWWAHIVFNELKNTNTHKMCIRSGKTLYWFFSNYCECMSVCFIITNFQNFMQKQICRFPTSSNENTDYWMYHVCKSPTRSICLSNKLTLCDYFTFHVSFFSNSSINGKTKIKL